MGKRLGRRRQVSSQRGRGGWHSRPSWALLPLISVVVLALPSARAQNQDAGAAPPAGQSDAYRVEPQVVTAYRVPTLLRETVQGVSIITAKDIGARNPASVADLLNQVPGLQVDREGRPGGLSSVFIRGAEANHTLIIVDGVRLNDPSTSRGGSYDLSSLELGDIERIEVVRGAASAIYGADAIGGVINIVTKRGGAGPAQGSVGGGVGGQGYRKAQASLSGGSSAAQFALNAAKLKDGREGDGGTLDLSTLSGSLAFAPLETLRLRVNARYNDRESSAFPEDSGGVRFAVNRHLELKKGRESSLGADLGWDARQEVQINVKVSGYEHVEDINSPAIAKGVQAAVPASDSHTDFKRDTALLSASLKLPHDSDLTLGAEHLKERGENKTLLNFGFFRLPNSFVFNRDTNSLFAEVKARPTTNSIAQLGLRHDSITAQESVTSPSVGVRYQWPESGSAVKANYGEGFKPPSFFALGNPIAGNPKLLPEKSRNSEIGFEQSFLADRGMFNLSLFHNLFRNLIDFVAVPRPLLINRDQVIAKGLETEIRFAPSTRWNVSARYTYVDTRVENSNVPLRNRPKNRAGISLAWLPDEASRLSVSTEYVGRVFDTSVPVGDVFLSPYWKTDLSFAYKFRWITATVAVDNLFDKRYEQFYGFADPGRRTRVSLSAAF